MTNRRKTANNRVINNSRAANRRNSAKVSPVYRGRRLILMLLLLAGICVLLMRAAYLDVFQQSWLKKQAGKRQLRTLTVPPYRGMIVDRNGEALAISSPVSSISIDPRKLADAKREMNKISLEGDENGALAKQDLEILDAKLKGVELLLEMPDGSLQTKLDSMSGKTISLFRASYRARKSTGNC